MIFKKKTFWIAFFSLLISVGIAVLEARMNPSISPIEKMESGINGRNKKKILSAIDPEYKEDWEKELDYYNIEKIFGIDTKKTKIDFLYESQIQEDDNGNKYVRGFRITTLDKTVIACEVQLFPLTEKEGKKYLDGGSLR